MWDMGDAKTVGIEMEHEELDGLGKKTWPFPWTVFHVLESDFADIGTSSSFTGRFDQ